MATIKGLIYGFLVGLFIAVVVLNRDRLSSEPNVIYRQARPERRTSEMKAPDLYEEWMDDDPD